ncbi:hypothetical protein E9531_10220 [Lampropedia puyangensis]|uniref:Uncharacterized protein n=1 Tax=Lampropedia puyangensis TaxID=1330072 RepID=A0A4S8F067_9BURK|nr:hypothetical protein [Lampropedia puyangensis]THU00640.1 hypothetical protein E9531_10220 [Lampropedia puyangensis]
MHHDNSPTAQVLAARCFLLLSDPMLMLVLLTLLLLGLVLEQTRQCACRTAGWHAIQQEVEQWLAARRRKPVLRQMYSAVASILVLPPPERLTR